MARRKHKLEAYYKAMTTDELQALMNRICDRTNHSPVWHYKNGELRPAARRLYDAVLEEWVARKVSEPVA